MGKLPKVAIISPDCPQTAIDILSQSCEVTDLKPTTKEEVLEAVAGVDAIFWAHKFRVDKEIFDAAGDGLKVVATCSAGINNVDYEILKARGIKFGHTPGVVSGSVADTAVLLTLAAMRRLREGRLEIENKGWKFGIQWMLGQDLQDSTIGIVGLGGIGQATAKRFQAFEVSRIIYSGNSEKPEGKELGAEFVPLEELLKESDVIVVACPLTDKTFRMFNDEAFGKMKRTAVFVNVGRGDVVDQPALERALENHTIFAAGLDVMTPEPLPSDHKLLTLPNCILMPHLGTATGRTRNKMAEMTARNILAGLEGKPMPGQVF